MRKFLIIGSLLALFGCGRKTDMDFKAMMERAQVNLQTKTASHQAVWDFGKAARWDLNQDNGVLVFTYPDKTVTCDAQIIGSFDKSQGTWLWAWDNPSVAANLTKASKQLLEYGKQHGFEKLTRAEWKATEQDAWDMAALATLICQAQGAYRGPAGDVYVFMTFGAPKITKNAFDGETPQQLGSYNRNSGGSKRCVYRRDDHFRSVPHSSGHIHLVSLDGASSSVHQPRRVRDGGVGPRVRDQLTQAAAHRTCDDELCAFATRHQAGRSPFRSKSSGLVLLQSTED